MLQPSSRDAPPRSSRRWSRNQIGRLMFAIMAVTVIMATFGYTRLRSVRFHQIAGLHLHSCVDHYARSDRMRDRGIAAGICDRATRLADHHLALVEKYSQAARHPWLPIAADPPEPE